MPSAQRLRPPVGQYRVQLNQVQPLCRRPWSLRQASQWPPQQVATHEKPRRRPGQQRGRPLGWPCQAVFEAPARRLVAGMLSCQNPGAGRPAPRVIRPRRGHGGCLDLGRERTGGPQMRPCGALEHPPRAWLVAVLLGQRSCWGLESSGSPVRDHARMHANRLESSGVR